MCSKDFALFVDKISGYGGLPGIFLDKGSVIAVRDKTDILAVRLVRVDEALLLGNLTDLCLGIGPQREKCMGKLLLGHGVKDIALILGVIQPFFQKITSGVRILLNLRIVAADNIVCAQFLCFFNQGIKFQEAIAVNAGIGSTSV